MVDVAERTSISNGGYLCKKFRTAAYPSRVGYNLGYCFPTSSGSCPSGWLQFSPSSTFCYIGYYGPYYPHDEIFRQCHQLGADMVYIASTAEYSWLQSVNLISSVTNNNKLNGHGFRYGPGYAGIGHPLYWSNGVQVTSGPFGILWSSGEPNDYCDGEMYLEYYSGTFSYNDIPGFIDDTTNSYSNGVGSCKRPLCGMQVIHRKTLPIPSSKGLGVSFAAVFFAVVRDCSLIVIRTIYTLT